MNSIADLVKNPNQPLVDELFGGMTDDEQALIREAYNWATEMYGDRVLPIGELVITHVLGVARQASALHMDAASRIAAILSRLPSFLPQAHDEVSIRFGDKTRRLILGLEKLRRLDQILQSQSFTKESSSSSAQAEALRKMLLVLADDMRMVVLKLISRIQTLRYIYKFPTDSAREVAFSTLHFFAPLANRLGLQELKWPLEDWAFRIIEPQTYKRIAQSLYGRRKAREELVNNFLSELRELFKPLGINYEAKGRVKHLYSIHRKTQSKLKKVEELFDLHATRILLDNVEECYQVLAAVHGKWSFLQNEFDDYIARPKDNGYQSIHSVIIYNKQPIEVQIRTQQMHELAESGLASHWRYKEGVADDAKFEERLLLLRELMDWQKEVADEDQRLKVLTEGTIYCLTPKGQVFDLPHGATPLDFAYRIHSELGHRCRGAKIDGALMPLSTPLKSGQCVDIMTAKEGAPSRDWLLENNPFLKSSRARAKVRQWFNINQHEERILEGRASWQRIQSRLRPPGKAAPSGEEVAQALGFNDMRDFYLAMSRGVVGMHQLQALVRGHDASLPNNTNPTPAKSRKNKLGAKTANVIDESYSGKVSILDMGEIAYQKATCCTPLPPHAIIGYITRNNVVSIHRAVCHELWNISNRLPERVVAVAWKRTLPAQKLTKSVTAPASKSSNNKSTLAVNTWQVVGNKFSSHNTWLNSSPPFLAEVMAAVQNSGYAISTMHFEQEANEGNPVLSFSLTLAPDNPSALILLLESLPTVVGVTYE